MWHLSGENCKAHVIQIIRRYTCVYEWKIQYHKYVSFPLLICKFTVVPFKSQEVKENLSGAKTYSVTLMVKIWWHLPQIWTNGTKKKKKPRNTKSIVISREKIQFMVLVYLSLLGSITPYTKLNCKYERQNSTLWL